MSLKLEIKIEPNLKESKIVIFTSEVTEEIKEIINKINKTQGKVFKGIKDEKIYLVNPNEIYYFYAENQKVLAKIDKHSLQIKSKLYELEEQLEGTNFIRISNSVIANIDKIKNLEMSFNGTLCIRFINGDVEYSSRRYVKKIKEYLGL
ncbi:LytTR family DNA-binding domain-containing protein [Clostridium intestinale]|jgi:DNA-binding LytR/AlgR family response regulator|uniref:LytTR family DNA-binding domain-containing protein n=1 Tax=Clostridium intestinale TaxID=36845 RepID=UPI0028EB00FB|nr:LytTR family DNA-binding domain-containing protein [Clostridium intestinale]